MTRSKRGHQAFTLIELLVVISIIAILMALTTAGVMRVKVAAQRAKVSNEIGQLGSAISVFKRDRNVGYIPSRIVLRERMDYNLGNALEVESHNYLKQVWSQLPVCTISGVSPFPAGQGINWNGNVTAGGAPIIDNGAVTLEGDQCLVFFLGGIPQPQGGGVFGMGGFSKNPRDPSATPLLGASTFDFNSGRLKLNGNAASAAGFPSYMDPFGAVPYVYFSGNGRKNGYNAASGVNGDCATVMAANGAATFAPYFDTYQSATQFSFYLATEYQIVCAGFDKTFGLGGVPANWKGKVAGPDADNVTNFHGGQISSLEN